MHELVDLGNKLDNIKDRLIVIETKMDAVKDMQNDMKVLTKTADDAHTSAKAAHKRLDGYDKHIMVIWVAVVGGIVKMLFDQFGGG